MAVAEDRITIGEVEILETNEDPRNTGGLAAPLGSIAIFQDEANGTSREFKKFGTGDSDWRPINGPKFEISTETEALTTSTAFGLYNSGTVNIPYTAKYKITLDYTWSHDATQDDFDMEFDINAVQAEIKHRQEPKDSGGSGFGATDQRMSMSRSIIRTLNAGNNTFEIYYRTSVGGVESSLYGATITIEEWEG